MFRPTHRLLSKASKRTVVRDPRKATATAAAAVAKKTRASAVAIQPETNSLSQQQQQQQSSTNSLPFEPNAQNQQSVGSTMASYVLAGAGVAMGVTFVRVLFGA